MMPAWDKSWEKVYQTQGYRAKYPNEELVRYISRLYKPFDSTSREKVKILEVGCGPGAHTWYLSREGFSVYSVDGSPTAIATARKRLYSEGLEAELILGDLVELPYPDNNFDGAIDVAAMECNTLENIKRILSEAYRVLRPGGKFFSFAIKVGSYGYGQGDQIEDNTVHQYQGGAPPGARHNPLFQ